MFRHVLICQVLLSLFFAGMANAADATINKGIWRMLYGPTSTQVDNPTWLAADDDGDGLRNQAELDSGTNPFQPNSALKVTTVTSDATTVSLTFPTVANKSYIVQATTGLTPTNWQNVAGVQVTGDGANKTLTVQKTAGAFFRVLVQDLDRDGDGVSDWAEQLVGLNPLLGTSNGQLDVNGLPITDLARANAQMAAQGTVTISAIDSTATQPSAVGQPAPEVGKFRITRSGFSQFLPAATINLSVTGSASAGTDYDALPASVNFLANETSKEIQVTPVYNAARKTGASVIATIVPSANYTIGGQGWAAVIINPTAAPSGTGLLARYYDTSSGTYADAANFGQAGTYNFTRNTSPTTTGSIVVSYTTGNLSALQIGHVVKLSFTSGNLNNATYNHQNYTVTGVAASSFTVSITGATALPASGVGNCSLSIQSFVHPPVVQRVDPTVNFDYLYGTPNGAVITTANLSDNYSVVWEGYLNPAAAGAYTFQLDADDKARVLLDLNDGNGLQQILEHGWEGTAETVGVFKQSAAYNLVVPARPSDRYRIRVEHVETTGDARCRLQWKLGSGTFADIPSTQAFSQRQALSYSYTRLADPKTGTIVVTPTGGHNLVVGNQVQLDFTTGNLFTPTGYSSSYTITAVTATTFTVAISSAVDLPATGTGNGVFMPVTQGMTYAYTQIDSTTGSAVITPANGHSLTVGRNVTLTFTSGNLFTPANLSGSYIVTAVNGTTSFTVGVAGASVPTSGSGAGQVDHLSVAQGLTYAYTQTNATTGTATITPSGGHSLSVGRTVALNFTTGNLFTPTSYSGNFTVTSVSGTTSFTVDIAGASLPASGSGSGFVDHSIGGWLARYYPNATFAASPTLVRVDTAVTNGNSGNWGPGSPDGSLIGADTFSARWTGQVQPQFSEDYTFVVQADDGCILTINGQVQPLKLASSTNQSGSTYVYNRTTGDVVVTYSNLVVPASSFAVGETVRLDPASGNLTHATGSTYSYNGTTGDAVIDYSNLTNITAGSIAVGETIELDPTSGTLTSLSTLPYVITAVSPTTFTVNFGTGVFTTGTGTINIADTRNAVITAATATTFTVNFGAGKYVDASAGNMSLEIVNKAVKDWNFFGSDRFVRIPMIGGVRYDIQLEYFEGTGAAKCQLSWYSPSQPKQIIPAERLYPANGSQAGASVTSPISGSAVVNGEFTYTVTGSNGGTVSVSGNPAWLTFSGGVLSGTPPPGASGDYQILITTTNANGSGTSVLNLHVDELTANITREYWTSVSGSGVSVIPVGTAPSGTSTLSTLQAPTDFGDNYGTRIRGYITAPVTGNYYFWLAASDDAELWISNDSEPVNKLKRASVTGGSTTPQNWAAAQKSPWLALEAGQRYYIEILHKAGAGSGDNLAVGWLKPGQTGTVPSEVVPSPVLSPYFDTPALANPGTLYVATMLAQPGAVGSPVGSPVNGVGSAVLRLSADETYATFRYTYSALTGPIQSQHIHIDPYLTHPSSIVYDIDQPETPGDGLQPDGSHKWTITAKGTFSPAEIREAIKQGKAYINLHTAINPTGEIRGNFTLAVGSRTFTAPPAPPTFADDHATDVGAMRFLTQATFGPNIADIAALKGMASYEEWIDDQFTKPASTQLAEVLAKELSDANGGAQFDESLTFNAWWRNAMTAPDQLRQRIAYALSQIHVVSATGPLDNRAEALSYFYDKLTTNAFGNFRDILEDTTLTPTMGRYLDMLKNDKPDQSVGRIPNENYAREIMQLFSVGLYRVWPDGSLVLNSKDSPIDTYTQREIVGLAHVFTGWDYGYDGAFRSSLGATTNWTRQMREVPARHFMGPKRILNNEVLPGLSSVSGLPLDPYATHSSTQYNDPTYQALPAQELDASHNQLFNHPNVGPFICRQLIQRLVMSNPSRDYLYRVVQKFNDNGSGVRGDMKAVIKAILLDYEARSADMYADNSSTGNKAKPTYGKQREPVLRVAAAARAFRMNTASGTYSQGSNPEVGDHVIKVTMANKFAGGNSVFLEFPRGGAFTAGDTTPTSEAYTVLSTPAPTSSLFYVNAKGWTGVSTSDGATNGGVSGTYSQTAGSTTMTITIGSHWLGTGNKAYLDFTAATTGTAVTDGIFTAITSDSTDTVAGTTFTVNAPDTTARTGRVRMVRYQGSYTVSNSGLAVPQERRITLDTTFGGIADHHLTVGSQIYLNFTVGNPQPPDAQFTVESVPDANSFTVLTNAAGTGNGSDSDNGMWMFPLVSQPITRNGNVGAPPSTFLMNNTGGDFDQTPLNSPTVFNFFLPDYKYSGTLASQGITTPEFQLTAETTVVREANFIYNGLFNPGNTTGISSFKSGGNALVMDFSPWMTNPSSTNLGLGAPTDPTKPWTNNENVAALIDHLNVLLVAGQLSTQAKTIIRNFVAQPISSISLSATACTVTTATAHSLQTGDSVVISGVNGGTFGGTANALNSSTTARTVTVTGTNTFTIPLACTVVPTDVTKAHVSVVPYNNATTTTTSAPSTTHMRDRLRAIIHLILTSPDFTIQR